MVEFSLLDIHQDEQIKLGFSVRFISLKQDSENKICSKVELNIQFELDGLSNEWFEYMALSSNNKQID